MNSWYGSLFLYTIPIHRIIVVSGYVRDESTSVYIWYAEIVSGKVMISIQIKTACMALLDAKTSVDQSVSEAKLGGRKISLDIVALVEKVQAMQLFFML